MSEPGSSLERLKRAALRRAVDRHGFRCSEHEIADALKKTGSLRRAMRELESRQTAEIRVGYALDRLGRLVKAGFDAFAKPGR